MFETVPQDENDQYDLLDKLSIELLRIDGIRSTGMRINPKELYNLLKDYIGEWHYIDLRRRFLSNSEGEKDVRSLLAAIEDIQDIRQHVLLQPKNINALYAEAKRLINSKTLFNVQEKEKLTLLIFVLHQKSYFNLYPLPDEAFEIDDNGWDKIGEVWGKYVRFYLYLRDLLGKVEKELLQPIISGGPKERKKKKVITSFQDLFAEDHEGKYHIIMDRLCNKMPDFKELEVSGNSVVTKNGDIYKWNPTIPFQKSYAAGILQYCNITRHWFDKHTLAEWETAVTNTFGSESSSTAQLKKARKGELSDYVKPFAMLLQDIK